jgi:hypothetical protein
MLKFLIFFLLIWPIIGNNQTAKKNKPELIRKLKKDPIQNSKIASIDGNRMYSFVTKEGLKDQHKQNKNTLNNHNHHNNHNSNINNNINNSNKKAKIPFKWG